MRPHSGPLAAAVAATLGAAGGADATVTPLTLTGVTIYTSNGDGMSTGNISSSTATWSYDDVTGLLTQTGGTFNVRYTINPVTTLFRHSIEGLVTGNGGAATATTYRCAEGNFGGNNGASLCGNYNFGANYVNESVATWGPGTAASRTMGGDDNAVGPQQSLLAYDGFSTAEWTGTQLTISNGRCEPGVAGGANNCGTLASGRNAGFTLVLKHLPNLSADYAVTTRNVAAIIPVLANDFNLTDPVTVGISAQGLLGTAVVNGSGGPPSGVTITYTPDLPAGQGTTSDIFTYDANGLTAAVGVTIKNQVPKAVGGNITTISTAGIAPEGLTGTFTAPGPIGGLGDGGSVSSTTQGGRGAVTQSGNILTYTVTDATFFTGTDSFTYSITDTDTPTPETSGPATVNVTIADVSPVLADGEVTTDQGKASAAFPLGITLGNGAKEQHSLLVTTQATSGSCALSPDQTSLTYIPNVGFSGHDSCVVTITDGDGDTDTGTLAITVAAVLGAVDDTATTALGTPVVVPVLANDAGFSDPVIVALFQVPEHGSVSIAGSPGPKSGIVLTYTPMAGFIGNDEFRYLVDDGSVADVATVTVQVIADPDGDGVGQAQDNCTAVSNPDQRDTDGDGYGNRCDADFDNNGFVNYADLAVFRQRFGTSDPDADLDGNGFVNFTDLAIFRGLFGKPPGPSGAGD